MEYTMSLPVTLIVAVQAYYRGESSLDAITQNLGSNPETIPTLLQEIAKASMLQHNALSITYTDRIITLAERLTCMKTQTFVANGHFAPALARQPITKGDVLTFLFDKGTTIIPKESFEVVRELDGPVALTISFDFQGIFESLQNAAEVLGHIQEVVVAYVDYEEDDLNLLFGKLPEVKKIDLSRSLAVTDDFLAHAALPRTLEEINLWGTNISAQGVATLFAKCPLLKRVNLTNCNHILHEELAALPCPESLTDILYDPFWKTHDNLMLLEEAARLNLSSPVAASLYVQALLESNRADKSEAIELLAPICQARPSFIPAQLLYIELLEQGTGKVAANHQKAKMQLARLEALHPVPSARMLALKACLERDLDLAYDAYTSEPYDEFVLAILAELALENDIQPLTRFLLTRVHDTSARGLTTAADLVKSYAADVAEERYKKALSINPHNIRALFGLATLIQDTRIDEAIPLLLTLISLKKSAKAYYALAKLHERKNQTDEARSCYDEALQLDPNNPKIQASYGELLRMNHQGADDREKAVALFSAACEPREKKAKRVPEDAHIGLAALQMEESSGKWANRAEALKHAEKACGRNPGDLFARSVLGELLLPVDSDRGIAYLEELVYHEDEIDLPACFALLTYYIYVDSDKADTYLELAERYAEDDVRLLVAKAKRHIFNEVYDLALELLEDAQTDVESLLLLTEIYLAKGENEKAKEAVLKITDPSRDQQIELITLFAKYPTFMSENNARDHLMKTYADK